MSGSHRPVQFRGRGAAVRGVPAFPVVLGESGLAGHEVLLQHPNLLNFHNVATVCAFTLLRVQQGGISVRELSFFVYHNPVARLVATVTHAEGELVQVGVRAGRDGVGGGFHARILTDPGQVVNPHTQQINLFIPGIFRLTGSGICGILLCLG